MPGEMRCRPRRARSSERPRARGIGRWMSRCGGARLFSSVGIRHHNQVVFVGHRDLSVDAQAVLRDAPRGLRPTRARGPVATARDAGIRERANRENHLAFDHWHLLSRILLELHSTLPPERVRISVARGKYHCRSTDPNNSRGVARLRHAGMDRGAIAYSSALPRPLECCGHAMMYGLLSRRRKRCNYSLRRVNVLACHC
jgi:hypothetical protein